MSLDGALAVTGLQPGQWATPPPRAGVTTVTRRWGLSTEAARGVPGPGPRRSSKEPALAQTDTAAQAAKQAALLAQLSGVGGEERGHRPTGSPGSARHTMAGLSRDPEACLAGCLNGLTPLLLIHPRAQHRGGLELKDSPWGFPRANALRLWQSSAPRLGLPRRQGRLGLSSDTVKQRSRQLGSKKSLAVCRGPSGLATIQVNPKTELGNCPELLSLAAGSGYGAHSPPRVVPVLAGSRGGTSPCGYLRGGTARLQRQVPPTTSQRALGTEMLPGGRLCP